MAHSRRRRRRSQSQESYPPGRYISAALLAFAVISAAGSVALPFLAPVGIPLAVSGIVSAVGFAALWAVLKNLRELNAALNDEYSDDENG
jgi:hypothetical protein